MRTLYFISLDLTASLLEKIQATESQYEIIVCTKESSDIPASFQKYRILQLIDSSEGWRPFKLLPFFIMKSPAVFHFMIEPNKRNLHFLAQLLKEIPGNQVVIEQPSVFRRLLNNPSHRPSCFVPEEVSEIPKSAMEYINIIHEKTSIDLTFFGWGKLPIYRRHQVRRKFENDLQKINFFGGNENFQIVMLAGLNAAALTRIPEFELVRLALQGVTLFLDEHQFMSLKGPWVAGDSLWILKKDSGHQDLSQILDSGERLKFASTPKLQAYFDELENSFVRLLNKPS